MGITVDEAREMLEVYTHYGVIVGSVLASVVARYATLPWIHVIGGVFTRRELRERLCLSCGIGVNKGSSNLRGSCRSSVEVGNEPAIRVCRNFGYKITKTRTWIFVY